jgi:hypothetical protein
MAENITTEENITTLLDKPDAENVSGSDYLYLVQGTGSDRDRKISLKALFASSPAHTLVVDGNDENPGHYLIDKFNAASAATYLSGGDVGFVVVSIRGARFIAGVIENQAVTTDKLADDAVTNPKIARGAVSNGSLSDNSVSTDKIIDGNVTPEKIDKTGDYTVKSLTTDSVDANSLNVTNDAIIGGNAGVNGNFTVSASKKLTAAGEAELGNTTARKLTLGAGTDGLHSVLKADSTLDLSTYSGAEGEIKIVCNTNNQYPIDVTCTTGTISIPVHGAHMFVGMGSSSWFSIN